MIIEMARIRARPLEADDAEFILELRNDESISCVPPSCAMEHPISPERVRIWIKAVSGLKSEMHMVLVKKRGGNFGLASVTDMDLVNRSACIGLLIQDRDWRGGYGTEAIRGVTEFLFQRYNLHRIWARAGGESELAMSGLVDAGFEVEGTLRQDHYSGGGWRDTRLLSVLSEDHWGAPDD